MWRVSNITSTTLLAAVFSLSDAAKRRSKCSQQDSNSFGSVSTLMSGACNKRHVLTTRLKSCDSNPINLKLVGRPLPDEKSVSSKCKFSGLGACPSPVHLIFPEQTN